MYTINVLQEILEEKGRKFKIHIPVDKTGNEPIRTKDKIIITCLTDGYEFSSSPLFVLEDRNCMKCIGKVKKTFEEVKREIEDKHPVEILSCEYEYKNNKSPLILRCEKDGHIWKTNANKLLQGRGCPKCAGKVKVTYKDLLSIVKNNNITVLSKKEDLKNSRSYIKLKCDIDKYEWEASYNSLQRGHGCPKCAGNNRRTYADLKEILESSGKVKILSNILDITDSKGFIKNKGYVKLQCLEDMYIWEAPIGNVIHKSGCPKCGGTLRRTYEDIKESIEVKGTIEVLTRKEEYTHMRDKIHVKCLIDNNEWYSTPADILHGYGCPLCGHKKYGGGFTLEKAEKYKNKWITQDMNVYVIKCFNYEELFYKIGVSINTVEKRFAGKTRMPYNYEVLKIIRTNKYLAKYVEDYLHTHYKKFHYRPKTPFKGHTECFSEIKDIDNIADDIHKKFYSNI